MRVVRPHSLTADSQLTQARSIRSSTMKNTVSRELSVLMAAQQMVIVFRMWMYCGGVRYILYYRKNRAHLMLNIAMRNRRVTWIGRAFVSLLRFYERLGWSAIVLNLSMNKKPLLEMALIILFNSKSEIEIGLRWMIYKNNVELSITQHRIFMWTI